MSSYSSFSQLLAYAHHMPPVAFSLLSFLVAYSAVIVFAKCFGKAGLYTFIVIAIIAGNIQVLKISQFSFFAHPVALGTELFAATFLATDVLNEVYGTKAAKKAVLIGFFSMLLWTLIMLLTLAFQPVANDAMHQSMERLFTPAPMLLIASFVAYLISQLSDVSIFSALRRRTAGKHLWFRNNLSTLISALIDNTVFSSLAFFVLPRFVFGTEYVQVSTLIFTYILGTYAFRVFAALFDTPFMYVAKKMLVVPDPLRDLSHLQR